MCRYCIGSGRVYRDISWFHRLIGKTRPYIKNYGRREREKRFTYLFFSLLSVFFVFLWFVKSSIYRRVRSPQSKILVLAKILATHTLLIQLTPE